MNGYSIDTVTLLLPFRVDFFKGLDNVFTPRYVKSLQAMNIIINNRLFLMQQIYKLVFIQ